MRFSNRHILFVAIALLIGLVFITYKDIWLIYFQADEWFWFKKIILFNRDGIRGHLRLVSHHFVPLFSLSMSAMHSLFGFDQYYYGLVNFILQIINVVLVFTFVYLYSKKSLLAFLSGAIFATLHTPNQAVIWYGTSLMSLPAATLGLLSLCSCLLYVRLGQLRYIFLSMILILIGLLFYEGLMSMLLFLPLWIFIEKKKLFTKTLGVIVGFGAIYVYLRSKLQINNDITITSSYPNLWEYVLNVVRNIFEFPFLGFSQLFVPSLNIYLFSLDILKNHPEVIIYLTSKGIVLTDLVVLMNTISIILSVFIVLVIIFFLKSRFLSYGNKQLLFLMVVFSLINLLPYTLLPKAGLESRHYYFSTIGASIAMSVVIYSLLHSIRLNFNKAIIIIALAYFIFIHISSTRTIIRDSIKVSDERKSIVTQVTHIYTGLPDRTLFYSEGDPLPFQSGFGEMLMVLNSNSRPYYVYFESEFLTHMASQGYEEKGNIGFGYFYSKKSLIEAYNKYRLQPENVYSFQWVSDEHKIYDTTDKMRKELELTHLNNR